MMQLASHPSWFVRKDLDGFFGLMIDNLIQLILIVGLCRELIRLPDSYIFGKILPGAAISILVGNFFTPGKRAGWPEKADAKMSRHCLTASIP